VYLIYLNIFTKNKWRQIQNLLGTVVVDDFLSFDDCLRLLLILRLDNDFFGVFTIPVVEGLFIFKSWVPI